MSRVAGAAHVRLAALDQLPERGERDRVPARGVGERDEHLVAFCRAGARLVNGGDRGPRFAQRGELLVGGQGPVADVVDPAGERVHGRQRAALRRGQQPDAV